MGAAQKLHQPVVDDLDHHLGGGDALDHLLPDGALTHLAHKVLDHRQRHVGFQQGDADLPQRLLDVALAQGPPPAQPVEDAGQSFGQTFEHGHPNRTGRSGPTPESHAFPTDEDPAPIRRPRLLWRRPKASQPGAPVTTGPLRGPPPAAMRSLSRAGPWAHRRARPGPHRAGADGRSSVPGRRSSRSTGPSSRRCGRGRRWR